MPVNDLGRFALAAMTVLVFIFGDLIPINPNVSAAVAAVGSSIAWALSTMFEEDKFAAGTNLLAALFAALSTGFYYQTIP